ncbi:MIP/aquaporin family protein [Conexibacter woesei]|uniref:MIP family channel protein n=1 Tax=Conexibacter woesei (strain DSM 14684 / CCUG 47730 / CIP 108061 / JCM 11494 / NBRC 100937 / ID131577) TaxID=469383 RepID=D3F3G6_CONWI|nr:MIP/aquaporin family protein [Conexibacter woesei]ADB52331.1 MIP family channel protein [Conexibacter woesei DSM 14684]
MSATQPAPKPGGTSRFGPDAAWRRSLWGDVLGEFAGTFILILLGVGSVAMAVAALPESGRGQFDTASWLIIAFGWGFGVTFGVYVAGGVTGAHLNPAVTLAFALKRGFAWAKVPWYMLAQLAGAFVAAFLLYELYGASIDSLERARDIVRGTPESVGTFSIFATFPAGYFGTWWGPFFDQVVGTAMLVFAIFALVDNANQPPKSNLAPVVVGFVVVAIGLSIGANAGYAINPARDLGPRLVTWIEGWKTIAVPGDYGNINSYMWIPIVGPFVGGAIGAFLYDFFIGDVLKSRGVPEDTSVEEEGTTEVEQGGRGATAAADAGYVARDRPGDTPPGRAP